MADNTLHNSYTYLTSPRTCGNNYRQGVPLNAVPTLALGEGQRSCSHRMPCSTSDHEGYLQKQERQKEMIHVTSYTGQETHYWIQKDQTRF